MSVDLGLDERGEDRWIVIQVTDTGIGIPQEKADQIFERFFQHDVPGSMVNQGSGIGLSITKEFVRIHGGEIAVASEVEQGTTVRIILTTSER